MSRQSDTARSVILKQLQHHLLLEYFHVEINN